MEKWSATIGRDIKEKTSQRISKINDNEIENGAVAVVSVE